MFFINETGIKSQAVSEFVPSDLADSAGWTAEDSPSDLYTVASQTVISYVLSIPLMPVTVLGSFSYIPVHARTHASRHKSFQWPFAKVSWVLPGLSCSIPKLCILLRHTQSHQVFLRLVVSSSSVIIQNWTKLADHIYVQCIQSSLIYLSGRAIPYYGILVTITPHTSIMHQHSGL